MFSSVGDGQERRAQRSSAGVVASMVAWLDVVNDEPSGDMMFLMGFDPPSESTTVCEIMTQQATGPAFERSMSLRSSGLCKAGLIWCAALHRYQGVMQRQTGGRTSRPALRLRTGRLVPSRQRYEHAQRSGAGQQRHISIA
jgi:hypothetical protein